MASVARCYLEFTAEVARLDAALEPKTSKTTSTSTLTPGILLNNGDAVQLECLAS